MVGKLKKSSLSERAKSKLSRKTPVKGRKWKETAGAETAVVRKNKAKFYGSFGCRVV